MSAREQEAWMAQLATALAGLEYVATVATEAKADNEIGLRNERAYRR
jgi:hypothetical protein